MLCLLFLSAALLHHPPDPSGAAGNNRRYVPFLCLRCYNNTGKNESQIRYLSDTKTNIPLIEEYVAVPKVLTAPPCPCTAVLWFLGTSESFGWSAEAQRCLCQRDGALRSLKHQHQPHNLKGMSAGAGSPCVHAFEGALLACAPPDLTALSVAN